MGRLSHTPHAHLFIIWSAPRWKMKRTGGVTGGSFVMLCHVLGHHGRRSTCGFHQCVLNMRAPQWLHVFYVVCRYWTGLLLFIHSVVFDRSFGIVHSIVCWNVTYWSFLLIKCCFIKFYLFFMDLIYFVLTVVLFIYIFNFLLWCVSCCMLFVFLWNGIVCFLVLTVVLCKSLSLQLITLRFSRL